MEQRSPSQSLECKIIPADATEGVDSPQRNPAEIRLAELIPQRAPNAATDQFLMEQAAQVEHNLINAALNAVMNPYDGPSQDRFEQALSAARRGRDFLKQLAAAIDIDRKKKTEPSKTRHPIVNPIRE